MALLTRYWLQKVLFLLLPILIGTLVTRRTTSAPDCLPLHDQSIQTLQDFLQNGTLTSEELVQIYLHRIEESTAAFHPVAEINPRALEIARQLDVERRVSGPRSPLHGLPVLVKDSISAHGMNNTAGSLCLVGSKTHKEASVISRFRNAGAIILGKANMSQWGNSRSSPKSQSNGWSAWGGQTLGAFYPNQDPRGSSSGSAVAMSLDLASFTVGVETVGSMICPASRNNVVGIKTTSGLVARDNVIVTKMRGSIGPFAKTIRDAAIALSVMAGKSPEDPTSQEIPFESIPDYEKLAGWRIFVQSDSLFHNMPSRTHLCRA
ncbi:hypothetical protein N7536_010022 [Penicillium majusculum]|nr:hypothetical protein N7536_010022 [Penicillium majusculum]